MTSLQDAERKRKRSNENEKVRRRHQPTAQYAAYQAGILEQEQRRTRLAEATALREQNLLAEKHWAKVKMCNAFIKAISSVQKIGNDCCRCRIRDPAVKEQVDLASALIGCGDPTGCAKNGKHWVCPRCLNKAVCSWENEFSLVGPIPACLQVPPCLLVCLRPTNTELCGRRACHL